MSLYLLDLNIARSTFLLILPESVDADPYAHKTPLI